MGGGCDNGDFEFTTPNPQLLAEDGLLTFIITYIYCRWGTICGSGEPLAPWGFSQGSGDPWSLGLLGCGFEPCIYHWGANLKTEPPENFLFLLLLDHRKTFC